ncbi:Zinc metalloproteinase nas-14 [Orchesella cincta]|uniref:Metalloendopeptidase n=1 Tax=Orchesella cincta TaxID=48709 RepID=A0A1D2MCF8_ORCCI|nr:Zinc metalloproteinase nas-14 [Orchesella cincta]
MFLDPEYNDDERKVIEMAPNDLQKVLPCVKFWIWPKGQSPAGYKERYIHIKKVPSGCSSDVGKTKTEGAQTLSLAQRCVTLGTVIHEMIHALGFHHEHSQPDRDKYVTVNLQNVQDNRYNAFRKYTDKEVSTFGVPYNTKSLMHYSSKDFSKDGKPTIVTKVC